MSNSSGVWSETPLSSACIVTIGYLNSQSVVIKTLSSFSYVVSVRELSPGQLNLTEIETIYDCIKEERPAGVEIIFVFLFAMSHDVEVSPD